MWATVNERDNQGDEIPPDLLTIVREGQNFGWPGCQPPAATPQDPGRDCSGITPPTIGLQAHGAPLGLAFSTGQQFPPEYANDLFVVQHGSWNRDPPAEPKLVRIHFDGARPVSAQDFATGWQNARRQPLGPPRRHSRRPRRQPDRLGRPVGQPVPDRLHRGALTASNRAEIIDIQNRRSILNR